MYLEPRNICHICSWASTKTISISIKCTKMQLFGVFKQYLFSYIFITFKYMRIDKVTLVLLNKETAIENKYCLNPCFCFCFLK